MAADWVEVLTGELSEIGTVEGGVRHFVAKVSNELEHGLGLTAPGGVGADLREGLEGIVSAVMSGVGRRGRAGGGQTDAPRATISGGGEAASGSE